MLIAKPTTISTLRDIEDKLKKNYKNKYSFGNFGFRKDNSVIVKKSFLVGAQVSIINGSIDIEGIIPGYISSLVSTFFHFLSGLGSPYPFKIFKVSPWKKLEDEIASALIIDV